MAVDIERFNADWLAAWSAKDVERLLLFYAADTVYRDAQVPAGVRGRAALRAYLTGLFAVTPPMRYDPDEVWPIPGGYCGRWICTIASPDGSRRWLRGFDLVLLDGDQIALNEVYTHTLEHDPREA
jgi:nuclear transport factor 2 (NTF2) superfamily protein